MSQSRQSKDSRKNTSFEFFVLLNSCFSIFAGMIYSTNGRNPKSLHWKTRDSKICHPWSWIDFVESKSLDFFIIWYSGLISILKQYWLVYFLQDLNLWLSTFAALFPLETWLFILSGEFWVTRVDKMQLALTCLDIPTLHISWIFSSTSFMFPSTS